ncbi:MAG TPA: gamma-glutamyltransferase, partial [Gammaproteobacteria bacterium]|nr:gamma-glutamyltransferase [Gammaproteobacteria bacterium]
MNFRKYFIVGFFFFIFFSQSVFAIPPAVAAADPYSVSAAEEIFKKGGNAVDAAVAIAFTLAVTYPNAGNIGGGGFMTIYINHQPYFLDYRERAPMQATKNMYLDEKGNVIEGMSLYGARAVGVPGTVAGMWMVHQRFGKLSWSQVLQPAIRYAEDGFTVSQKMSDLAHNAEKNFVGKTNFAKYFSNLRTGYLFKQPELAVVLKRI